MTRKSCLLRVKPSTVSAFLCLLFAVFCADCITPAQAGIKEISPSAQLVAADGASGDDFGNSVAISGSTLVAGSPYANGMGAAYIFTGSGATWTQIAKLTASDGMLGSQFGLAVAISGNTVAVGAPMQAGGSGAVYIFVEPISGWTDMTETAKLTYAGGNFGYSVAFGSAGRFLLTGAFFQNAVYAFAKPAKGWTSTSSPTADLVPPAGATAFGTALAASGNIVVVGAETTNNGSGAAYVFSLQLGVSNIYSIATLAASDAGGSLGQSVAIAGNTIVAGAPTHDNGVGAVYVFVETLTGWVNMIQTAELTTGLNAHTAFGAGVATSGGAIFVGLPSGRMGFAVDYLEPATGWANTSTPNIVFIPSVVSNTFGENVSFNGTTLAAGDFGFNQGQGAVYIFGPLR